MGGRVYDELARHGNFEKWAETAVADGRVRRFRREEVEAAVIAVFLHSQPVGPKARTPELLRMVGGSAPDAIELEKGLARWRDTSWFLDDEHIGDGVEDGGLPKSWRLGNAPNLTLP